MNIKTIFDNLLQQPLHCLVFTLIKINSTNTLYNPNFKLTQRVRTEK